MAYLNGRIGQMSGVFPANTNVVTLIDDDTVDTTKKLIHVGVVTEPGTAMFVNESKNPIYVGPGGIWEVDNEVYITSIVFEQDTEAQIDYIY